MREGGAAKRRARPLSTSARGPAHGLGTRPRFRLQRSALRRTLHPDVHRVVTSGKSSSLPQTGARCRSALPKVPYG